MDELREGEFGEMVKGILENLTGVEPIKRQVKIVKDKKQYTIRIPTRYAEAIKIDPQKDRMEFTVIPKEDGTFTMKAELKRG